jgi:hypothetical protein
MNDASSAVAAGARPDGHPPVRSGRIGVLIANLGTPDATDFWSMRRYLKEFLSDKHRGQLVALRARDRGELAGLEAGVQRHHPDAAAARQGPRL